MRIKVLGSAAGGGFPQWNCACRNCSRLRDGTLHGSPRTQTQIAFSPHEHVWFLLNASPDLRSQVLKTSELHPSEESSGALPIAGLFLPSAEVDSVMGLLHLREFEPLFVFATSGVRSVLREENRIFSILERSHPPAEWVTLSSKGRLVCNLSDPGGPAAFFCSTIPLGGAYPDYVSEKLQRMLPEEEAVVGFVIEKDGKHLFFAPSLSGNNQDWLRWAEPSDLVLIDGTFWSDDELIQTGRSKKTAREIGHLPLSGPAGLLAQYPKNAKGRKVLIHVNNTNPILDEDSSEHRAVLDAGFEIAYDGMEFEL
jgi:pyrroloquinoline quinone biosynthesis protein B